MMVGDSEESFKRGRTDHVDNFLIIYSDVLKEKKVSAKYERENELLRTKLREAEENESNELNKKIRILEK